MIGNQWVRQMHRWVSIVFTMVSGTIFIALGIGREPSRWVYSLPLVPLALLVLSGLYMFVLPYLARRRGARPARLLSVERP